MMENVIMMQTGAFPGELSQLLGAQFFSYVLPWLLTFAVVYGIFSHIGEEGLPQSNAARGIIGIVLAFIVAPTLSPYIEGLMRFSASFIMVIGVFLVFIILLEILGINKEVNEVKPDEEGELQPTGETRKVSIFQQYPKFFAFVIGVIALLVFFSSGAANAMGINLPTGITQNYPLLFFLGFMVLMAWWMITED